ncbi:MAG: flagellar assembly protein A [bacterium]
MEEQVDTHLAWEIEALGDDAIPGQLLAVKKPPALGKPGLTVTGEELLPQLGEDIPVILGMNVYASEDGLRIYSASFGKIRWQGNRVDVQRVLQITKDVEENIDFDGEVKVSGSVEGKFKIHATADVSIAGSVADAEIDSGGTVEIKQEVRNATIIAQENIKSCSAKESSLEAKGYILIEGALLGCKVNGERVICSGRKGIIAGGVVCAKKEINAMTIGSERTSIQTEVKIQQGGNISIHGILYPKVKMILGRRTMIPKRKLKRLTIKAELSGMTTTEYQEPKIEFTHSASQEDTHKQKVKHPQFSPSVIVQAASLEEGKRKGAELLGLPAEGLDGEIISNEYSNRPILRIFPQGASEHWKKEWNEINNIDGPPVDGNFKFENREDGLYLHIISSSGSGKKVSPENIILAAQQQGFIGIDSSKIIAACKTNVPTTVKIGIMQLTQEIGGKVKIDISEDKLKAYFTIIPPQKGNLMLGPEDVLSALKRKGVMVGIKEDVIVAAFKNKQFEKPILVAEAILPPMSQKAQITYRIGSAK